MMMARWSQLWALVCLCLCFNVVLAGVAKHAPRQDTPSTSLEAASSTPTNSDNDVQSTTSSAPEESSSASSPASTSASEMTTSATISSVTSASLPSTTATSNSSASNVTTGDLPIQPTITPGWGVAGVILMTSGAVYGLIGIKMQSLHTFFSVGYCAGLGVTMLILYVMNPPVTDAVQGAYVVAAVGTGLGLGGCAVLFKELTECLACVVGGFCLSMWFLTLGEDGLLQSTGMIIFIGVFSAVTFALYFSRFTRQYAMIGSISIAGATACVIGIDCFTRAGLKEFWAWIWNLNANLFPLEPATYPITRGMRVEQAATIIIFIIGVVSQVQLWQKVVDRRAKKAAARLENERQLEEEEAAVGREVESANARDRRQWESVYGDGEYQSPRSIHYSVDSGVGDMDSEKKRSNSYGTRRATLEEPVEMVNILPTLPEMPKMAAEKIISNDKDNGVTIQVASDDESEAAAINAMNPVKQKSTGWLLGSNDEGLLGTKGLGEETSRLSSPAPSVVPLPFKAPEEKIEEEEDDDRSSVATFNDEFDAGRGSRGQRGSLGNRLSAGSIDLLRKLSNGKRKGKEPAHQAKRRSKEYLVRRTSRPVDNDSHSVAATFDGSSDEEDKKSMKIKKRPFSLEIKAQLAKAPDESTVPRTPTTPTRPESKVSTVLSPTVSMLARADVSKSNSPSSPPAANSARHSPAASGPRAGPGSGFKSALTFDEPAPLTSARLPEAMSKVAISYRTNEWAKHLSHAELPSPDQLHLPLASELLTEPVADDGEEPAPVMVEELRQTPENAAPPPSRPVSSMLLLRNESRASVSRASIPNLPGSGSQPQMSISKASPPHSPPSYPEFSHLAPPKPKSSNPRRFSGRSEAIAEEGDNKSTFSSNSRQAGSPGLISSGRSSEDVNRTRSPVPGVISYSSPQTLIGQRDMLLRSKNSTVRPESFQSLTASPIAAPGSSDSGSTRNFSAPNAGAIVDADDLPLSQRKELIRQSSLMSVDAQRPNSFFAGSSPALTTSPAFNSHQPQRLSATPGQHFRNSQLASFRQSFQADLQRNPTGMPPVAPSHANPSVGGAYGVATGGPLINAVNPGSNLYGLSRPPLSRASLAAQNAAYGGSHDAEVQRDMEMRRSFLMNQKEAEVLKKETERWEKDRGSKLIEQRMRSGELLDLHREAMRRMQRTASAADRH